MQMSIKGDSICCKVKVALVNMIHHCDQEYKRDIRELKKIIDLINADIFHSGNR